MENQIACNRLERGENNARKWNIDASAGHPSPSRSRSSSHRHETGFSRSSRSLVALKAHLRRLRVFADVVKVLLVNLKEVSTTHSTTKASAPAGQAQCDRVAQQRCTSVARISVDDTALKAVQSQVKSLVEQGHVVAELDAEMRDAVTYRDQGDLAYYTNENLRKRAAMETHPRMVALTRRLWLTVVQDEEATMNFSEYEDFMLHLHRLIIPQFGLASSQNLIQADWTRDANGADCLDYRSFHLSMFELVDLWTDTVELNDYVALLYCIMDSLIWIRNERYFLKPLEDIQFLDILEASQALPMDDIVRNLEFDANSNSAKLYQDRLRNGDNDPRKYGEVRVGSEVPAMHTARRSSRRMSFRQASPLQKSSQQSLLSSQRKRVSIIEHDASLSPSIVFDTIDESQTQRTISFSSRNISVVGSQPISRKGSTTAFSVTDEVSAPPFGRVASSAMMQAADLLDGIDASTTKRPGLTPRTSGLASTSRRSSATVGAPGRTGSGTSGSSDVSQTTGRFGLDAVKRVSVDFGRSESFQVTGAGQMPRPSVHRSQQSTCGETLTQQQQLLSTSDGQRDSESAGKGALQSLEINGLSSSPSRTQSLTSRQLPHSPLKSLAGSVRDARYYFPGEEPVGIKLDTTNELSPHPVQSANGLAVISAPPPDRQLHGDAIGSRRLSPRATRLQQQQQAPASPLSPAADEIVDLAVQNSTNLSQLSTSCLALLSSLPTSPSSLPSAASLPTSRYSTFEKMSSSMGDPQSGASDKALALRYGSSTQLLVNPLNSPPSAVPVQPASPQRSLNSFRRPSRFS